MSERREAGVPPSSERAPSGPAPEAPRAGMMSERGEAGVPPSSERAPSGPAPEAPRAGKISSGTEVSGVTTDATSSALVVETHGLRKTFESEGAPVRALRGVDFTVTAGEFVAVMGPSGCGKSTLLNIIAGLDTPTDGEITLAGESLVGKSEDELAIMRRKHIGIVFQFFNLLESMSVLENVTLPAVIAGAPRKRAESRARDLLDLLGLADKAKDAPGVLSGGQRQRLAIARALANEPTLLLADEPTGALDSEGGHEVLELFRRLHAGGQTILLVTHDDEVAAAGDRIVRMRDGRVVSDDDAAPVAAGTTSAD